jgi:uncharacterized phage protein (TIGR01671 family)
MNRDIKFRAYSKVAKQMRQPFIQLYPTGFSEFGTWTKTDSSLEIMQFTGLKDKNGKEIYEGDILMIEIEDEDSVMGKVDTYKGIVIYGNETLGFNKKYVTDYPASFTIFCTEWYKEEGLLGNHRHIETIIGNIYENPELIKV